ncbi:hypothetical protein ACQEVF_58010 [Nonomuraea polychroma]|uniref:hypothetical protein n=1 Tax=Nonomuraea polychroma TaxID=46176 RepID=UPI003D91DF3F
MSHPLQQFTEADTLWVFVRAQPQLADTFRSVRAALPAVAHVFIRRADPAPIVAVGRRFGITAPERAADLLPPDLRLTGAVGPTGAGVYDADVSRWLASVRVQEDNGETFPVTPRQLTPIGGVYRG